MKLDDLLEDLVERAVAKALARITPNRPPPAEVSEYLTTKQAAALAKLGRSTLENYRRKNIGPKWTKLRTGQVRYKRADLEAYLARKDSK